MTPQQEQPPRTEAVQEIGCPHGAWGMVVPCPQCGSPRHVSPSRFVTDRFLAEVERGEREWPEAAAATPSPNALRDFINECGIVHEANPPGIDYVTLQVDAEIWEQAKTLAATPSPSSEPLDERLIHVALIQADLIILPTYSHNRNPGKQRTDLADTINRLQQEPKP